MLSLSTAIMQSLAAVVFVTAAVIFLNTFWRR